MPAKYQEMLLQLLLLLLPSRATFAQHAAAVEAACVGSSKRQQLLQAHLLPVLLLRHVPEGQLGVLLQHTAVMQLPIMLL
jgi:hypothetical protein